MIADEPEFFSVGAEVPRRQSQSQLGQVQLRPVGVVGLLLVVVVELLPSHFLVVVLRLRVEVEVELLLLVVVKQEVVMVEVEVELQLPSHFLVVVLRLRVEVEVELLPSHFLVVVVLRLRVEVEVELLLLVVVVVVEQEPLLLEVVMVEVEVELQLLLVVVVLQLQVEVEEAECPSDEFADAAVVLDVLVVGVEVVRLLHVDADEAEELLLVEEVPQLPVDVEVCVQVLVEVEEVVGVLQLPEHGPAASREPQVVPVLGRHRRGSISWQRLV